MHPSIAKARGLLADRREPEPAADEIDAWAASMPQDAHEILKWANAAPRSLELPIEEPLTYQMAPRSTYEPTDYQRSWRAQHELDQRVYGQIDEVINEVVLKEAFPAVGEFVAKVRHQLREEIKELRGEIEVIRTAGAPMPYIRARSHDDPQG